MVKKRIREERLNSFVIPVNTIQKMNELNHKTHQTGREQGMSLCFDKKEKKVVPGYDAEGDEISISIPEICNKGQKYIGSFHTHPAPSETAFSAMDLFSSCAVRSKIDCVGMNKKGDIVCFTRKNKDKSCQKDAKALVEIENLYGELDEEYDGDIIPDAVIETVDKLVEKKFVSKKIL